MTMRTKGTGGKARRAVNIAFAMLLTLFLGVTATEAQSPEALYARANELYTEGDYQQAIAIYEDLLRIAPHNGNLIYNLGNAYYKDGRLGKAILHYERASRVLPRDEDVRFNLDLARSLTRDKIESPANPVLYALVRVQRTLTVNEQTILAFAFYLAVAVMLVLRFIAPGAGATHFLLAKAFVPALVVLVLIGLSLGTKLYAHQAIKEGIIIVHEATVRSGPGEDFAEVFLVHEGTKAKLRNAREGWYQIGLPNGLNGWIPSENIEPIQEESGSHRAFSGKQRSDGS